MSMESQINDLANFIMKSVEGEPSKSEGACITAIRIIKQLQAQLEKLKKKYDASPFQYELDLKDERIDELNRKYIKTLTERDQLQAKLKNKDDTIKHSTKEWIEKLNTENDKLKKQQCSKANCPHKSFWNGE